MNKRKGTRNEHRSREWLETNGYRVIRAGGSLGVWDLVAVGCRDVQLIQCKTNRWAGTEEMRAMRDFVAPAFCRKVIHRWDDYARVPKVREVV